jgi:hypothetical protein
VARVLRATTQGQSLPDVLAEVERFPSDMRQAEGFVNEIAPAPLVPVLRAWAELTAPDEEIDLPELRTILNLEPDAWPPDDVEGLVTALAWLEITGESDGRLALNPVVHRALRRLDQ